MSNAYGYQFVTCLVYARLDTRVEVGLWALNEGATDCTSNAETRCW